jgi:hypothetical protein
MSNKNVRFPEKDVIIRHYEPGDEAQILDFLNLCYGEWGTIQKWRAYYADYPTFNKDDIVLMKINKEIIGHGGIHFRDLILWNQRLHTASLTDAAIHPHYREKGLYARLVDIRLKLARSRDTCLVFTWHLKGSNAYRHNKRIDFVEVKQFPVYMKVIRPEKVMKSGLFDLLHKNQRIRKILEKLEVDLCFHLGKIEFSTAELFGKVDKKLKQNLGKIEIVLDENSLFIIANFRNMNKFKRITSLIILILLGRAKIKFSSFKALLRLARKGVVIIDSI